jgi:cell division cycle protein 20 (cofactor of APC complex)
MDRFIPARSAIDVDVANFALTCKENQTGSAGGDDGAGPSTSGGGEAGSDSSDYQRMLAASLHVDGASGRILAFKHKAPAPPEGYDNNLRSLYTENAGPAPSSKKHMRHVPTTQERILDAPELMDDYYLNLLDWSCHNIVGGPRLRLIMVGCGCGPRVVGSGFEGSG